jgi:hypothetical protein
VALDQESSTVTALDPAEEDSRRGFVQRFGKLGAATFLGLFGAAVTSREAAAADWLCCTLEFPNQSQWCPGSFNHWTCPSGYHATFWTCCYSGRVVGCGECQMGGGSNCFNGSHYACSRGWVEQALC